jgi:hypothetical protein
MVHSYIYKQIGHIIIIIAYSSSFHLNLYSKGASYSSLFVIFHSKITSLEEVSASDAAAEASADSPSLSDLTQS